MRITSTTQVRSSGAYYDSSGLRHGYVYSNGSYTTIDDPLGTKGSGVEGINDAGQMVRVLL